jgi:hypothetical protein
MYVQLLVPLAAQGTAFYLFFAPLPEVQQQRKVGKMILDCTGFPVTLFLQAVFVLLGCMINDFWVVVPNVVGSFVTMYHVTTCLSIHADEKMRSKVEVMTIAAVSASLILMVLALTPIVLNAKEDRLIMLNSIGIVCVLLMFGTPCLEAVRAIKNRDASRLSLPLSIAGTANGMLWGIYGITNNIAAVGAPNAIGAGLSFMNLLIKVVLRDQPIAKSVKSADDGMVETLSLDQVLSKGHNIVLCSVMDGRQLDVQSLDDTAETCEQTGRKRCERVAVTSSEQGTSLQIQCLDAGKVSLRTRSGRFLQVSCRDRNSLPTSDLNPTSHSVWAVQRDAPGEEEMFVPVHCNGTVMCTEYGTGEYSCLLSKSSRFSNVIAFWNPKHGVFIRVNELGKVDASPVWRGKSKTEDQEIPPGWYWEHFVMYHAAGSSPQPDLIGVDPASFVTKV